MPLWKITLGSNDPETPDAVFHVEAANRYAATELALDQVTGQGEFWPPCVTAEELADVIR